MKRIFFSNPARMYLSLLFCIFAGVTGALKSGTSAAADPGAAPAAPPVSASPQPPCPGAAGDYVLGFSEEFDAPLNPAVWQDRLWLSKLVQPVNYEISNGSLKLWMERNVYTADKNFFTRTLNTNPLVNVDGVSGRTGYTQRWGCFEMVAKLPFGKGHFPAFWLTSADPQMHNEIDIMESFTRDVYIDEAWHPIAYAVTIHRGCDESDPDCNLNIRSKEVGTLNWYPGVDLSAGFHNYAAKWEPDKVTYFFDGQPIYVAPLSFTDPMYILLDTKPDPWSLPDDTTPTRRANGFDPGAIYEIQYVRAWCLQAYGCR